MKLPRDMDAAELIKALAQLGYRLVRQPGSHVRLQFDAPGHAITRPNHRPPRVGTLASIITDVAEKHRMERDALVQLLLS